MGFAPIKWTCTAFFRPRQFTDRAILASRQTREKKKDFALAVLFAFIVISRCSSRFFPGLLICFFFLLRAPFGQYGPVAAFEP